MPENINISTPHDDTGVIKRIPHPVKVSKNQEKIVLNYRFEDVVGYGIMILLQNVYFMDLLFN